jgi:hypothetical protein
MVEASAREAGVSENYVCWKCGDALVAQEQFCGNCGASRAERACSPASRASLRRPCACIPSMSLFCQRKRSCLADRWPAFAAEAEDRLAQLLASSGLQEEFLWRNNQTAAGADEGAIRLQSSAAYRSAVTICKFSGLSLIESKPQDVNWSSAAKARDFLETLAGTRSPGHWPFLARPARRFLSRVRGHSGGGRHSLGNAVRPLGGCDGPWNCDFRDREPAQAANSGCGSFAVR